MEVFEKMCNSCNRCDEITIEKCKLMNNKMNDEIIQNSILNNVEVGDYPLCSRCIHYQGSHSSIFGESWGCNKKVIGDVYDNDWHKDQDEDIVLCAEYVFGVPDNSYIG